MGTRIKRFQIQDQSIDSSKIQDGSISDTHVSNSAAIDESKIQNLTQDLNSHISLSGDTMTNILTLNAPPTNPLHAANKFYMTQTVSTASSQPEQISYISLNPGSSNLEIGPHAIAAGSGQTSNTSVFINLSSSSNFESGNTTVGTYYIYATGSGFKLSLSAPTFNNGSWMRSTAINWKYIGSVISLTSGTFLPFYKEGKNVFFKAVQTIFYNRDGNGTTAVNLLAPYTVSSGIVIINPLSTSTWESNACGATLSILDPDTSTIVDSSTVFGQVANNADRAVATQDYQIVYAPAKASGNIARITTQYSGFGKHHYNTIFQIGYVELV
jgi:hypothetical protein